MEAFDPVAGQFERVARFGVAGFHRGVDLTSRDAQAAGIEIKAVELARVAASISADTSRLVARNPANRWAKSALLLSRRTGMVAFRRGGLGRRPTAQWRGDKSPSTLCYTE
jgi:hypothetical protein